MPQSDTKTASFFSRWEKVIKTMPCVSAASVDPGHERPCTCHPDDTPPVPCQKKYALTDCRRAFHLQRVLIGGNHLALLIGADHPLHTVDHQTALTHYHSGRGRAGRGQDAYEAWCCWKTIMELRDAIDAGQV